MSFSIYEVQYPVTIFSVQHLIFLAVLLPLAVFMAFYLSRKFGFNKKIIWTCTVLGILCELERMLFFIQETESGYRLPPDFLPFNMCQFHVILMYIFAVSEKPEKRRILLAFMYPSMVGGAFMGIIIPAAAGYHGLLQLATYRYFFFHAMVIFFGLYLFMSKVVQFNIKDYGVALGTNFLALMVAVWVNAFFGWDQRVNHMFVVRPPLENLPILNLNHGWVVYMLQFLWIGVLMTTLCFLPVFIRTIRKKHLSCSETKVSEQLINSQGNALTPKTADL